jgi:5-methylcytosine-specific restriction enzyme subunit McrC
VIPVQNLYYLLCYAWNRLPEADFIDVDAIPENDLPNLLAKMLIGGVRRLFRQGIDRNYITESLDTRNIRGKLDLSHSIKRLLLHIPAGVCHVDTLHRDVLQNRIIRTTVGRLCRASGIDGKLQHQLRLIERQLRDISIIDLRRDSFRRVQLHRNNRFYRFLLNVCELCFLSLLADETSGSWRFVDFERDEGKMGEMFQDFVYHFYRIEQREFSVRSERFDWSTTDSTPGSIPLLPTMTTDVCLQSHSRKIVIECKFTKHPLQSNYGKTSVRSDHLYQLYAYLRNLESRGGLNMHCDGLLLYAAVDGAIDFTFHTGGHWVRVYALDLNRTWQQIKAELLALLEPSHRVLAMQHA